MRSLAPDPTPHRRRAAAVAALLSLASVGALRAAPLGEGQILKTARCERVDLEARELACDYERCDLRGDVRLECAQLLLWADEVTLLLGPEQTFAGAKARGNIKLVESDRLLTCDRLELGADRIQSRIDAATIRVKRDPAAVDARGLPNGRDAAVFHGNVERQDRDRLRIDDADFTLCDCGDEPPSWRIDTARIDATLDDRAVLWWPQLSINAFGLGVIPVTPPMLPLSVPLRKRAAGFLAPRITFLDAPWPIVDLPFFVPLGDSWDATLSPGMRFAWGRHKLTPVSSWGAPRLGAAVRYAPLQGTRGEATISWTWDRKGQAARLYRDDVLAAQGWSVATFDEVINAETGEHRSAWYQWQAREALEHRVDIDWKHRTDFTERLRFLVDAEWVSDDLVPSAFSVTLDDQNPGYIPSRTAMLWRGDGMAAELAADYLLGITTSGQRDYSNVQGAESATVHRGPYARFSLLPTHVAAGLYVDGEVSAVRYGAWGWSSAPTRSLGGARFGAAYRDAVGPLRLDAGAHVDSLWIDPNAGSEATANAAALIDAAVSTRLMRDFGGVVHVVEPALRYRALPWRAGSLPAEPAVDERLQRGRFQQGELGVDQHLWTSTGRHLAALSLAQPWDLESGERLAARALLRLWPRGSVSSALWLDLDHQAGARVQEAGMMLSFREGPFALRLQYSRTLPYAERFRRTYYEMAATRPPRDDTFWLHNIGLSTSLQVSQRVFVSYATDNLLWPPRDGLPQRTVGFAQHVLRLSYRSPCDCWEVGAQIVVSPIDPWPPKANITLAIGEYTVGN